jgi:hypothetical protein
MKKKLKSLGIVVWRGLLGILPSSADVAAGACYGLRQLSRLLFCLCLPRGCRDVWSLRERQNLVLARKHFRLTLFYCYKSIEYHVKRIRLWLRALYFWWLWLRLVHKRGLDRAVVDVRCRLGGFNFLPNDQEHLHRP